MNKNQKIFGGVVLVIIIVAGLCYAFYEKGKSDGKKTAKDKDDIKKNSKLIEQIEEVVNRAIKESPNTDANSTIGHLAQDRKDLFQGQEIKVVEAKPKKGAEDTLIALLEKETHPTPEAVSDLIEESVESILSNEMMAELDNVIPSSDSDQMISPKENSSKELATEKEMYTKISSQHGKDSLHQDLRKLARKMSKDDVEKLIKNISFYCPDKPIKKRFDTEFRNAISLMHFFNQIYKKHKLNSDRAEKFASILINNFEQLKNNSGASITTNWTKPERGKNRKELMADEDLVLL